MNVTATVGALAFVVGTTLGVLVPKVLGAETQIRKVEVSQLMKKDVAGCDDKEVTVSIIKAGPGTSKTHYHPGQSFTYILEGSQLRETGEEQIQVGVGDVLYDAPMQVHRTENTAPVRLLVVRILEKGKQENVIVQ
jgi:mannose-6-phosphate isomerase-like protein (cupin superfamily)